jgi:hypothetical protein
VLGYDNDADHREKKITFETLVSGFKNQRSVSSPAILNQH